MHAGHGSRVLPLAVARPRSPSASSSSLRLQGVVAAMRDVHRRFRLCPARALAVVPSHAATRVAPVAPDQTATDRIMMFIIAKPATPMRIRMSRPCLSAAVELRTEASSSCAS